MNPAAGSSGRGPGRPSNREKAENLAARIEAGLKGFADLLERRDEADSVETLAALIKRDARGMAEWLAALADSHAGAEKVIVRLFGAGSLVGAAGAFGPLASALYDRIRLSNLLGFLHPAEEEPPPGEPSGAAFA